VSGEIPAGPATERDNDSDEHDSRFTLRSEANQHIADNVNDQLDRVRSNESFVGHGDEFEAQLDDT